jgi:hypothetical protein
MQLITSVKRDDTSLPTVMLAITFFTASIFFSRLGELISMRSSWTCGGSATGRNKGTRVKGQE